MSSSKRLILSIDDSRAVHAFLDQCLRDGGDGFEFVHAMGVKEGLGILKERGDFISLILLDWEMPEVTGFDGLPMLLSQSPRTPVVVLTSKNNPEDITVMLERGAKEYMMKPFTPDILFEKIKGVLGE